MATKEIVGLGSVWEDDFGQDDLVGLFKWKLEVRQDSGVITTDFTILDGNGDSYFDGYYNLTTSVKMAEKDYNCDTEDGVLKGKRVLIACTSVSNGKNADFSVSGTTGSTDLGISFSPGYSGQRLVWQVKLEICPGFDDCADIRVLLNRTSVTDTEYFWGDLLTRPRNNESSIVRRQQPQIAIGDCGAVLDPNADGSLPIALLRNVRIDTATA